jgi:malto-oligosyltrehalose synthase
MNEPPPLGSTYRVQLAGIGFQGARILVPYLAQLGVQTLYVSPILAAVPGSTHGYDVIDPTRLDSALGTPEQFEALLAELDAFQMRLLIDVVPNHMATSPDNPWWWDVLRVGQASPSASVFDVDWSRHEARVLLPVLSRPLGELVNAIEFTGEGADRQMVIDGQGFPVAPGTDSKSDVATVLARQHFRPAFWRLSNHEGNYRRFFDIDGLVGVRVEDPEIFERTHRLLLAIGDDERVAGWRVDHVDGLTDPLAYLSRLASTPFVRRQSRPVVLVEKILSRGEELPAAWEVDGTTGYEFADRVGGVFVDPRGAEYLRHVGRGRTGDDTTFFDLALEAKRDVLVTSFDGSLQRLTRLAMNALDDQRPGHDLSSVDVRRALGELTVRLDAYRSYISASPVDVSDRVTLSRASDAAAKVLHDEPRRALDALVTVFTSARGPGLELVQRWQQLTGAVMAKGVEDTATYRYAGLLSHADVGGDPDHASLTPVEFHRFILSRIHPSTLNATSTHDSKRSEDSRARLFTLSDVPEAWDELVATWEGRLTADVGRGAHVDAHDRLVAYQSLFCLWPTDAGRSTGATIRRVQHYAVKAAREHKQRTNWIDPSSRYERSLMTFIGTTARDARFQRDLSRFVKSVGPAAATNSLAMTVLKCVVPGVPDFYQGSELWDFTLTDPDNRRPIDFKRRQKVLARLPPPDAPKSTLSAVTQSLLRTWEDGAIKLYTVRALLHLRRDHSDLFARGSYEVLVTTGPLADHVIAVCRRRGSAWVIAVVPRQVVGLAGPGRFALARSWGSGTYVKLPRSSPRQLTNVFTGARLARENERIDVGQILSTFPVSVLTGDTQTG